MKNIKLQVKLLKKKWFICRDKKKLLFSRSSFHWMSNQFGVEIFCCPLDRLVFFYMKGIRNWICHQHYRELNQANDYLGAKTHPLSLCKLLMTGTGVFSRHCPVPHVPGWCLAAGWTEDEVRGPGTPQWSHPQLPPRRLLHKSSSPPEYKHIKHQCSV